MDLFQAICAAGLEGIVAKKKTSRYVLGERSKEWIKIKNWRELDCYVMGYRLDEPGVLLGRENQDGEINYVGVTELGLSPTEHNALINVGRDITVRQEGHRVWLRPLIKCKVKHVGVTNKGHLRDAYFKEFIA